MDNAETVCQAIHTLYGPDSTASAKANIWLGEFQKSLHAWEISDQLLHRKNDDVAAYFAAQTMRTKIQCSFQELPASSHEALRLSILQHLDVYGCNPEPSQNVIVTQLCLALADLYLQVASWAGFVNEIFAKFGELPEQTGTVLCLLKVFPEENDSRYLRLGANRRQEVFQQLAAQTSAVVNYLGLVCERFGGEENLLCRVLDCLGSWLLNPRVPSAELAQSPLLLSVLRLLNNIETSSKLHDSATDCIVQALYLCEDLVTHEVLATALFSGIHALLPSFHTSVAMEDLDKLQNYCRLFTELTESVLPVMVETPGAGLGDLSTLNLILDAVGYHDYSLAEMTFNVWYRLSELVYQQNSDVLGEAFRPYIERLLVALYRHCRLETDHLGTPDDNSEFSDFRCKVTEAIRDVVFLVGSTNCFRQMLEFLKHQSAGGAWDETESALFVMSAVAKNLIPDEDEVVPVVVEALLGLPPQSHVAIRYTAIQLLGQLHEWLNHNAQFISRVLDWLLVSLNDTKLGGVTTEALELICDDGRRNVLPHLDRLCQAVIAVDASAQISEASVISLLKATAAVITSLPREEIGPKVQQLCANQAQRLALIVEAEMNGEAGKIGDPVVWVDRLSAVFRQLTPSEADNGQLRPWLPVIQQVWPLLIRTCDKYRANTRVVEHCCRAIRFAIRSLGIQSFPFIEPLVNQMVNIYSEHQHSCFLYLGSILVDEYGQYKEVGPGLLAMLQAFSGPSFKLLEAPNGFRNNPDTVDDLFRLCSRFIQKAPFEFLTADCAGPLLHCGLAALSLDHRDANQSVTKFFQETIEMITKTRKKCGDEPGRVLSEQLVMSVGKQLVENVLAALIFHLSTTFVRDMASVLFALRSLNSQLFSEWLMMAVESLPQTGCSSATKNQLHDFHTQLINAGDLRLLSGSLRDLVRLYR